MIFEPSEPTVLTQELRLATTMTGGVSLAIWMAGVAREINLLAQASQWRRAMETPDNRLSMPATESLTLYAKLINLLDIVVDVDILSGTSAGGINAALLASSRVKGYDLGGLRDLWLDLGALTDLLRDPADKTTPSLLYGDERLFAVLAKELPNLAKLAKEPPDPRPPTTLYVTTTLLAGETSQFTDSFGTLVQDVDRRGLFTFTERDLAKDNTAQALALAARSSASFPLAFEPSFVPFRAETPEKGNVPARPAMKDFANITRSHWAADGGLLDNQPIDVLLKRIFDSFAERPVRRVLLFVVPSSGPTPDLAEEAQPDDVNEPLGLGDALLKDLAAITTQSIAADLRAIRTHQDRMEARTNTRLRLVELARLCSLERLLTKFLLRDYMTREATKLAHALTSALLRQLSTLPPTSDTKTESVLSNWQAQLAVGGDAEKVCRHAIKETVLRLWSGPLPEHLDELPRYGQSALDVTKGCALSVFEAAYQLASSAEDIAELAELTQKIHEACEPPKPANPDKPLRPNPVELARAVCASPVLRHGSLADAAAKLARDSLDYITVQVEAWEKLGQVFVDKYLTLKALAGNASSASEAPTKSVLEDLTPASQLNEYLNYLKPDDNAHSVAMNLFDLAVTQRAMLPAEADIEQSLDLVQVSADTRSLLAPNFQTAQQKLTGMQFHHFGAFYKRSWRANDWLWGRLDGAGWLVHVLLDPRRVRWIVNRGCEQIADGSGVRAQWFLDQLTDLGAPVFPASGYPLPPAPDGSPRSLTESMLRDEELAFLDDDSEVPPSIPLTSLWLAQAWQRLVVDEELDGLAKTVTDPQPGKTPDWSPTKSRTWAEEVQAAEGEAKYALLNENPVAKETFSSDRGSPLMAHTITKAAATASAAAGSVRQLPGVLKPPVITLQTLTLGGYRVVSLIKGKARSAIIVGAVLLVLGVAFAIQDATWFGVGGLIFAWIGGYLIVLGTWQSSSRPGTLRQPGEPKIRQRLSPSEIRRCVSRPLVPLVSLTLVGVVLCLATPVVRHWLFGKDNDHPGLIETHAYWLGAQWWRPLVVIGIVLGAVVLPLVVSATAAAKPGRRLRHAVRSLSIAAGAVLLVFGVADAIQDARPFAVGALVAAWVGCYLIVLGTWWRLGKPLLALAWVTLVGAALCLATPVVRQWLFGTDRKHAGLLGTQAYWLGAQWWHPLIVVGIIALVVTAILAANPAEDDEADRSSTATDGSR